MPRERAIPCRGATLQESIAGTHKTWADDGYCDRCRALNARVRSELNEKNRTDSCLVAATHAATSDRVVTATRSATGNDTGSSSALLPLPVAFSLPDRYATGRDAPAAPLGTSQAER